MKLVSVIIPTYNRAQCLVKAIQSALNQTYSPLEIIVVDDGSTDNTPDIISKFSDNIVYIRKENGGVSSARNYGIKISHGDLIAFLDSDDVWLPGKLQKQVEYLEQHPDFGMVLCDCFYVDAREAIISASNRRSALPINGNIFQNVILNPSLIPSSVLVIKGILQQVGLFDESLKTAEDLDIHLKISKITKIGLITEPLFAVMRGHQGLSMLSRTYDDHVQVIERFLNTIAADVSSKLKRKALFKVYQQASKGKFWHNEWLIGIKYGLSALKNASIYNSYDVINIFIIALRSAFATFYKQR